MKTKFQSILQNKYLQPIGSPVDTSSQKPTKYIPWEFGINQRLQAKQPRFSKISVKSLIQEPNTAVGTGSFANGATLFLTSTLAMNPPHQNDITFAIPYIAIYQGTYASVYDANFQIYPTTGGSITPFTYTVQGETDWHLTNGTNSVWGGAIKNSTGVTGTISFLVQWRYFFYNSGAGATS